MSKFKKLIACLITVTTLAVGGTGTFSTISSSQTIVVDNLHDLPYEH